MGKFTDRFVKVPTKIYNIKQKELTGNEGELEDSYSKFNPFDICEYRPASDTEDGVEFEDNCTSITLKDGNSILAYINISDFEKLLNNHNNG